MPWRELADRAAWQFVRGLPPRSGLFLQTPGWAGLQRKLGAVTLGLGWYRGNTLVGCIQLLRASLPFGRWYWLAPKGPCFTPGLPPGACQAALQELVQYLAPQGPLFLRLEPEVVPLGACRTIDHEPRATAIVDLTCSREQLFARMHEKTRYNIRLAERKGVQFRWGGLNEFNRFWYLLKATARREGFRVHAAPHYRAMLELWGGAPLTTPELACRLGLVEYQGELLAASLVLIFNAQATYLHGASSRRHRELMAPHLLHGAAMRELATAGCLAYDLWGIQPSDGDFSDWAGFTRFKLGFGGRRLEEPGTFDYPLARLPYTVYRLVRRLRRVVR